MRAFSASVYLNTFLSLSLSLSLQGVLLLSPLVSLACVKGNLPLLCL